MADLVDILSRQIQFLDYNILVSTLSFWVVLKWCEYITSIVLIITFQVFLEVFQPVSFVSQGESLLINLKDLLLFPFFMFDYLTI